RARRRWLFHATWCFPPYVSRPFWQAVDEQGGTAERIPPARSGTARYALRLQPAEPSAWSPNSAAQSTAAGWPACTGLCHGGVDRCAGMQVPKALVINQQVRKRARQICISACRSAAGSFVEFMSETVQRR